MNCIVIDDEPLARKGMQLHIAEVPALQLVGEFSNAIDAGNFLAENSVDIIFLDIQMPKITGFEFLRSAKISSKVVITTAYPEFAVDAFDLDVCDYLVKPIRFERFYKCVSRIMQRDSRPAERKDEEFLFIRTERKYIRTSYDEIDYIEGLKDYVIVHCGQNRHIVATNLKNIAASLPAALFIRISKSYIINISGIRSIDNDQVILAGKTLPVGENYRKYLVDFLANSKVLKR